VNSRPPRGEFLSTDELIGAVNALSPDDKFKLDAIEGIRRRGTGFGQGELLHEATCRTILGARACPRDVAVMAFLVETMRSIASHDRVQRKRFDAVGGTAQAGEDGEGWEAELPATAPSPEDDLLRKEEVAAVQAIFAEFDDYPDAQLVLLGWQDELRGAALREATGLDQGQLDYAIRRIRARMRKKYPQGWKP
jgi:hypothetical protein